MLKKLILAIFVLFFVGCGYQPSSVYTKKVLDGAVFVEVDINRVEPENSHFLTDELRKAIVNRFSSRVSEKKEATNIVKASYQKISFTPLAYDKNGYVISYNTTVSVDFELTDKFGKVIKKEITSSSYESSSTNSLKATELKTISIKRALEQNVDEFIAFVALKGTK